MLKALSDYYDYLIRRKDCPLCEKGFSKVDINFNMVLSPDGTLVDILPYTDRILKGKKEYDVARTEVFPFRFSSTSISAETIDHREKYNFGLIYNKDSKGLTYDVKSLQAFNKNKENFLLFCDGLSSPVIDAYRSFLSKWIPENETQNEILSKLEEKYANAKFVVSLEYENDLLNNDPLIKQKWASALQAQKPDYSKEKLQCSISGKLVPVSDIPLTHTKLKGIAGGLATGMGIVSFNSDAFCSYNKDQSQNSFVRREIMEKYTEAFNYLASEPKHKQNIRDMTLLFWAMTDKNENLALDCFSFSVGFNNDIAQDGEIEENISSVFESLKNGLKPNWESLNIDENAQFFILGVKPNSSRLAIKTFRKNSFGSTMENIAQHHLDLQLSPTDRQLAFWQIEKELQSPVADTDISPDLNVKMLQSILDNSPYPLYLLNSLIYRVKTDKDNKDKKFEAVSRNRVRLIRACLIRNKKIKREDTTMLNTQNKDSAYNCGRLFAILEAVQTKALPGINATIKDRFFSSACSTPYLAFPRLLKLSQNHISKLEGGIKVYYEKMIQEVIGNLDDSFPKSLDMEKQGIFILGYYQQRQDFFKKNDSDEKGEEK